MLYIIARFEVDEIDFVQRLPWLSGAGSAIGIIASDGVYIVVGGKTRGCKGECGKKGRPPAGWGIFIFGGRTAEGRRPERSAG